MTSAKLAPRAYLLSQLAQRDIQAKHKGTFGGFLWLIGQPLLMLAIYTLVFGLVFQPKWDGLPSIWDFSLVLFLGKIPYIYVLETVGRSPSLMAANASYVKKTQFPLEFLVGMSQISALAVAGISLLVWVMFFVVINVELPPLSSLLLPVIYLPFLAAVMGICLLLASLGAYFKDVSHIVQPVLFSMMFLSPVFYPIAKAPVWMRDFLAWNPMGQVIEQSRAVIYFDTPMDWAWWLQQLALGLVLLCLGQWWFSRTRAGFAEVL